MRGEAPLPAQDTEAAVSDELGARQFADASHLPLLPVRPAVGVLIVAGAGFAAVAFWIGLHGSSQPAVDLTIHHWVVRNRSGPEVTVARAARWGGMSEIVLAVVFVVGLAASVRRGVLARLNSALALTVIAAAGVAVENGTNSLIDRARPPVADWAGPAGGASFPSGHATDSMLAALACAWALCARLRPGWPRRLAFAAAGAYALFIGWSRIWLGVHWPTDVLAGWLFGLAWVAGAIALAAIVLRSRWPRRAAAIPRP